MIKWFSLLFILAAGLSAHAEFYVSPNIAVGYNTVQDTYYHLGVDLGYFWDENIYFGLGGYYAFGDHPTDDREYGVGPFIGYHYPFLEILSLELREDVDYVSERNPYVVQENPEVYSYTSASGVEFATYVGLHISFTRHFGISGGYRFVVGPSNLVNGRSGTVLGLTLGL
jgi:hypothetical protein